MFQFLTILLAVTAVVTKAVPLTMTMMISLIVVQQQNVWQLQTEEKKVDLGNISAPAYIMDLFTNISNKQARQNQVLSKDDLVNVVISKLSNRCSTGCFYLYCLHCEHQITYSQSLFPPSGHCGH